MSRNILCVVVVAFLSHTLLAQNNLRFGNPGCEGDDRELADRRFFVFRHSSDLKIPLWVSYELRSRDVGGPAPRPSDRR